MVLQTCPKEMFLFQSTRDVIVMLKMMLKKFKMEIGSIQYRADVNSMQCLLQKKNQSQESGSQISDDDLDVLCFHRLLFEERSDRSTNTRSTLSP